MADKRFFTKSGSYGVAELAERVGGRLLRCPDPEKPVEDVATVGEATGRDICFLENRRYVGALETSKAGVCLLPEALVERAPETLSLIVTERPRRAFARIAALFYPDVRGPGGIHPSAHIDAEAELGDGVEIGPGAVIGARVKLGAGVRIGASTVIGAGVEIGPGTVIAENASISHALIGARVVMHPGARVGTCGFGFEMDDAGLVKMPQLGRAIIGDDVEIGVNSSVDRGSGPDTVIGRGTMIDNLVHVAHNVQIGKGCIICGQTGIAGSTRIGDHVVLAGQVGVNGHIEIGDGVQVAAQSGVTASVAAGQKVGGMPAVPIGEFRRQAAVMKALVRRRTDRGSK